MATKSGTSRQVITKPQGGGALRGIGENFSPDLFTGTGNFTVPISVLPCRNAFQPELNLIYSTGNSNGPFGLGWSLSIPGVRSKDGLISYYDTPEAAGHDPAVVADPSDRTKVLTWKLTMTCDPFGNRIEYRYRRDPAETGSHTWDQVHAQEIRYVDHVEATTGSERFLASISFDYGTSDDERPDPFSDYRAGFEVRTRKGCKQIAVRTRGSW